MKARCPQHACGPIVFSGIDCSGKSTQIGMLAAALRERGADVEVMWHRPGYSRELDTLRRIARKVMPTALPTAELEVQRVAAFRRPGVAESWIITAFLDSFVQFVVKLRTMLAVGKTVICDRYVMDGAIDLALRFPHLVGASSVYRRLELLAPRPAYHFLLMIGVDEMRVRAAKKNEPFQENEEARLRRYAEYVKMAEDGKVIVVDAARSPEEVHRDIVRHCSL